MAAERMENDLTGRLDSLTAVPPVDFVIALKICFEIKANYRATYSAGLSQIVSEMAFFVAAAR